MELEMLIRLAREYLDSAPENRVSAEDAIRPELAGMRIYDAPLLASASADDPLFSKLLEPQVIGEGVFLPTDWLPEARSVLAFFLPFTDTVRQSNRSGDTASDEWLHARIEGQIMLDKLGRFLCEQLEKVGYAAVYPATDPRFRLLNPYASNWSERHVAHVCGLGTFGLSKSLITAKGTAGRFGSIVTSAPLPAADRLYDSPFAYCTMCGACAANCPAGAIDVKRGVIDGKDQTICGPFVRATFLPPHGPNNRIRYGCGKCQVGVPCESGIPLKALR